MKILCTYILILILGISSFLSAQQDQHYARRIQDHLILHDYQSAKEEAQEAFKMYPDSPSTHENLIKTLALVGEEKEMMQAWTLYASAFPERTTNRDLIEEMCWGVLQKSFTSPYLPARLISLVAGFFSQDVRGIAILKKGMYDSNSVIRSTSVELAGHLRDDKLKEEIKRLFAAEQTWLVRQCVLKAIGTMKIKELKNQLTAVIESEKTSAEEKALAIGSLVVLLDEVGRDELLRLSESNRAGLRLLACQAIAHFQHIRDVDLLLKLAEDNHADVRLAAIQTIGLLRPSEGYRSKVLNVARTKIADRDVKVAISAAWLLTLYSPIEGQKALETQLMRDRKEERLLAAAALNSTGKYGVELAIQYYDRHPDPYVKINLALGLIGNRLNVNEAADVLAKGMRTERDKWAWLQEGVFQVLVPSQLKVEESPSMTPEVENQIVRLEILNTLAIVDPDKAMKSIRLFLQERHWGITGSASALLLLEGDDAAVEIVRNLLQDENQSVRVQAALMLSLWSREESAIQVLEQSYANADKEMKCKILEGIGRIGSMQSVPFLLKALREPSQYLRIIAATVLIQCLNH